jgi:ACR3 family arsenite efflux pump ArsB
MRTVFGFISSRIVAGRLKMTKLLNQISDNLVYLVCAVAAFSLFFPGPGSGLGWIVSPLLAFMVFNVSMTINIKDLRQVVKHPFIILWGVFLSFVVMALFSVVIGKIFLPGFTDLSTGQLLLGCLPADISAPLMVYLIGGDTALATAMLVIEMMLTPFVLPNVLTMFGGITLAVPVSYLVVELILIIIIPLCCGVFLNTYAGGNWREKGYLVRYRFPLLYHASFRGNLCQCPNHYFVKNGCGTGSFDGNPVEPLRVWPCIRNENYLFTQKGDLFSTLIYRQHQGVRDSSCGC